MLASHAGAALVAGLHSARSVAVTPTRAAAVSLSPLASSILHIDVGAPRLRPTVTATRSAGFDRFQRDSSTSLPERVASPCAPAVSTNLPSRVTAVAEGA